MASKYPTEEDVNKFLKANQDLLNLGITFSHNIDSAFLEFKKILELMIKSNFVERAVVEMLADSFDKLEGKVKSNLENIVNIYTEGGQWYSFYLGQAAGRKMDFPLSKHPQPGVPDVAKAQAGS
jgi:hypothetical protein